jgi:hypothetical protein
MVWSYKWRDQIASGFYYKLLQKGSLSENDKEPNVGYFNWYLEAFKELSSCRSIGMILGPIPFTAIVEYSRIYEVEDFDEFLYVIRRLDDKFMELESKKAGVKNASTNSDKNNHRKN